jgi:hypothetical protein
MKVCIYIDVKTRDIPSMTYISSGLKNGGHKVFYLPLFKTTNDGGLTYKRQLDILPDVVITPSYNRDRSPEVAIRSLLSGSIFIEFTSEQYYSDLFLPEKIPAWNDLELLRQDYYFVWSKFYAKNLINFGGVPPENIFVVGSPKVDISKVKPVKDKLLKGKNILFVSDYGMADFKETDIKWFYSRYKINLSLNDTKVIREERLSSIKAANMLAELGDYTVTFRVHPGEDVTVYNKNLSNMVRLSLATNDFSEEVAWSDVVIGYTTTSIFEIVAMRRPYISLHESPYPSSVYREFLVDCTSANFSQLAAKIEQSLLLEDENYTNKKFEYYSDNLSLDYKTYDSFYDALEMVNKSHIIKKNTKILLRHRVYFYSISYMALIFRILLKYRYTRKLLITIFPRRLTSMTREMNNFSKKDMVNLNSEAPASVKNNNYSFKLTEFGWLYRK